MKFLTNQCLECQLRKNCKTYKDIRQYTRVLEELPFIINNMISFESICTEFKSIHNEKYNKLVDKKFYRQYLTSSANTKYEITDEFIQFGYRRLYRIRALKDIPKWGIKAGDLGGYIEKEENVSCEGDCWIGDTARIYDDAVIDENAYVYGSSVINEFAEITGNAQVYGNALVAGHAKINNNVRIYGDAMIRGYCNIFENARIFGNAKIFGNAIIFDNAEIYGFAIINEHAMIGGFTEIHGDAHIKGHTKLLYNERIDGTTRMDNRTDDGKVIRISSTRLK